MVSRPLLPRRPRRWAKGRPKSRLPFDVARGVLGTKSKRVRWARRRRCRSTAHIQSRILPRVTPQPMYMANILAQILQYTSGGASWKTHAWPRLCCISPFVHVCAASLSLSPLYLFLPLSISLSPSLSLLPTLPCPPRSCACVLRLASVGHWGAIWVAKGLAH